jgi:membrane protein involved in colicin uptake
MPEEKKNLFEKAIDALTDRDEKEAEAKAKAEAEAARKKGAEIKAKMEAEAKEAAAERAAATKAAADKAIADKAAADRAASMKAATDKAAAERAAAQRAAAAAPKKGVVNVRSLHIRKDHSTTSAEVGGLTHGEEVTILETWSDGKNTWAKLGPDRWAAIEYNGDTLIKLS